MRVVNSRSWMSSLKIGTDLTAIAISRTNPSSLQGTLEKELPSTSAFASAAPELPGRGLGSLTPAPVDGGRKSGGNEVNQRDLKAR